jgi:hypothetical protein
MNNLANCADVIVSTVGMNIPCLKRWSIITRIEVKPSDGESCSIKSMEIEFHRQDCIGSCWRSL